MSELLARLKTDQITARKARNSDEVTFLATLIGEANAYSTSEKERRDVTDNDVEKAIKKIGKSLTETKTLAKDPEVISATDRELAILERYKPAMMSESDLKAAIASIRSENPDAKLGDIMGALKAKYGKSYDGKLASELAKAS